MVSGAIAYRTLSKDHPDAATRAVDLLKRHPFYAAQWADDLATFPEEERDLALFMKAARWPDDVRMNRQFHHGEWHYVNFPFKPKGQPRELATPDPKAPNILSAFAENLAILNDRTKTDAARAIALCWVFHLVGDVHQPLHTSNLITNNWPKGDHGGNSFHIRAAENRAVIDLHSFWDELVIGSERYKSVRDRATLIANTYPSSRLPELKQDHFDDWAKESFALVKKVVYLDGKLQGSPTDVDAPALSQEYRDKAKATAERRVAVAGYRLAGILAQAFR